MSSKTRKLALDLFQARPSQSHLQETSARNTREKASLRNGQWPASATEKETQRSLFQWFGTHMGKDCPDSHLAPALPGQRACIQFSVPRHCHTLAFTAQHNQTNAQQPGYARAHSPRVHNLGSPPGTPPACVPEEALSARCATLTWCGRPRAPVSRANLAGGPGANARHRMATSAIRPPFTGDRGGHRRLRVLRGPDPGPVRLRRALQKLQPSEVRRREQKPGASGGPRAAALHLTRISPPSPADRSPEPGTAAQPDAGEMGEETPSCGGGGSGGASLPPSDWNYRRLARGSALLGFQTSRRAGPGA